MQKFTVQKLATAGVVGAAYAALALFGSIFGVTYGPIQCRFSEALCVLPFLFPETAWGLGIGCLIANVFSPYGLLDIVVGSCATFLAALLTARCKKKWLAPLPPVVLNMLLVGAMLAYEEAGASAAFGSVFLFNAATRRHRGGHRLLRAGHAASVRVGKEPVFSETPPDDGNFRRIRCKIRGKRLTFPKNKV